MSPRALETLRRIEAYTAANFREPISVDDVAKALRLNRSHISRVFREARGRSLTSHLTERRVRHAQTLLSLGAATVLDAALASGFGSMSRFYEAFRRVTGTTPTAASTVPPPTTLGLVHALWVDDEPLNNIVERRQLASLGILTDNYTNTADALRALDHGGYGLILSDITRAQPGDSGWQLAERVRNFDPHIPLYFYVGRDDPDRRRLAKQLGVNGIFVRSDELLEAIRKHFPDADAARADRPGAARKPLSTKVRRRNKAG